MNTDEIIQLNALKFLALFIPKIGAISDFSAEARGSVV
jgi:hypothetical protein